MVRKSKTVVQLFFLIAAGGISITAGPNKNASVELLLSKTEPLYYRTHEVKRGDECLLIVRASNVEALHAYSVNITFNKNIVEFCTAAKTLSFSEKLFLESAGGKLLTFLAVPRNGSVEIAATLIGKELKQQAKGDGVLGYLKFKALNDGKPELKIKLAKLIDCESVVDSIGIATEIQK